MQNHVQTSLHNIFFSIETSLLELMEKCDAILYPILKLFVLPLILACAQERKNFLGDGKLLNDKSYGSDSRAEQHEALCKYSFYLTHLTISPFLYHSLYTHSMSIYT